MNRALIDGSVKVADNAVKSIDERWSTGRVNDHLRDSFAAMAHTIGAQAARATDPQLRAADRLGRRPAGPSTGWAGDRLGRGARTASPGTFLDKGFPTLTQEMDTVCRA